MTRSNPAPPIPDGYDLAGCWPGIAVAVLPLLTIHGLWHYYKWQVGR